MKNITNNNSEDLLETIFRNVPVGITVENRNGNITHANKAVAELFDFKDSDNLIGKNIKNVFGNYSIIDSNGMKLPLKDRPATKIFAGLEDVSEVLHFINRKDGRDKWLLIRASAVKVFNDKTTLAIKSFKDITQAVEEQKRRELFLGIVSHEIKNPLASIKAYIQLLQRKVNGNSDDVIKSYLSNINSQTDRLTQIVKDYLDLTRLSNGEFQLNLRLFSIDNTIDNTIRNFQLTTDKFKIHRTGKINKDIIGDEDRIIQVLINLLSNAIEHSRKGKIITVESKKDHHYVYISVKDSGIGIPKKYQEEIFKLFRTIPTKQRNKSRGFGMGLSISQAIIKSHGGEITLISKVNKGTNFTIKLPIKTKRYAEKYKVYQKKYICC